MLLDYTTLQVGQQVAVAQNGSWTIQNQGVYRVTKVNKVKVVVERVSDGYQREFSVRRRQELTKYDAGYHTAFLESVEDQERRIQQKIHEQAIRAAWAAVEQAGRDRNMQALQAAIADLNRLGVK
jgi:hypothetical protein